MSVGLHGIKAVLQTIVRFCYSLCEMFIGLQEKISSNEGIKRNLILLCSHIFNLSPVLFL